MEFILRLVYFQLSRHLDKPEISLLLGPRQAGKTTLLERLQETLKQKNQQTVFLNLDVIEDRQFFTSQHTLLDFIEKKAGKRKAYVFIDEISRLENAGLFLKGLYDLQSNHKFVVTGSGSLELRENVVEPLTGRKKVFYCFPLSFTEFAAYKLGVSDEAFDQEYSEVTKILATQPLQRQRIINEYLSFGGYPRVVLATTEQEKTEILREIYDSYLEKDIGLLLKVEKEYAFANLVKIIAGQVGNLINRAELASTLGLTEKTIERYLYLLEKTFVINLTRPFYRNVRKELVKSPKIYFVDPGFLYIAQGILPTIQRQPTGSMFENVCWLRLRELDLVKPPQFWRTKSGAEVDFVITSPKDGKPIPVEVKSSAKETLGKSLISFIKTYQPEEGFVYFPSGSGKGGHGVYGKTTIHFVPYHVLPGKEVVLNGP
ncbi:ATP-binding protein [Candidatus Gottesmanbacteria bacterium]|nr:ATP-binding protein [Candidatus Gottesmanbacteria bacterium]